MENEVKETINIQGLNAEEILKKLYNKKLDCKKNILEYIEITRVLKKQEMPSETIQETYNLIYNSIEEIGQNLKPNTILHLKNQLKAQLGKLVKDKDPKEENHFIKFFKEAYPANARRKDFTWVLMDINKITEEQIWTTLTHINREFIKNNIRISKEEKSDIIGMIEKLVAKNNIKYVNQVKSMEKLLNVLNIKVVNTKNKFKIQKML